MAEDPGLGIGTAGQGSDGTVSGAGAFWFVRTVFGPGQRENQIYSYQTPGAARPLGQSGPWAQMADTTSLFPTYLGSFLQESDNHRSVPAAHCPIQRAHSAVVHMFNHGPMIHQELDLGHGSSRAINRWSVSACFRHCLPLVHV